MDSETQTQDKPKYGGQTTCGHPYCAPDPPLVQRLDGMEEALQWADRIVAGLREMGVEEDDIANVTAAIAKAKSDG